MGLLKVKNIDLRQKIRRRKRKEKKNYDYGRTSVRVLTAVTLLLTNAPPLEIGNLTPSSEKRARALCCLLSMNAKRGRSTSSRFVQRPQRPLPKGWPNYESSRGHNFHRYFVRSLATMGASLLVCKTVPENEGVYAHPYAPWERGTNEK